MTQMTKHKWRMTKEGRILNSLKRAINAFVILNSSFVIFHNLFAFFEIELAGGQDRDGFDTLDLFWNPQVWDAGIVKFVAQLCKIDIYGAQ
jgi:hypothetical protein